MHKIVSHQDWLAARTAFLAKEKEFTRLRDQLTAERLALPWERVEKDYVFDTADGRKTLADLFAGRSQLLVKHFMFGPDWEQGCVGCSFGADHVDGIVVHLEHHDISYVAVSRAPLPKIEAFRRRMGWHFRWVSSAESDFNFDYQASFSPEDIASGKAYYNYKEQSVGIDELTGFSVFYKDVDGAIYHTYSTYARGGEMFLSAYGYLDVLPKGRNETINGNLTDWVRHHDRYEDVATAECCHK
jgi:predicted dithiol-disulfide oxidoreductase (DUF899 family)